jgi:hypothetical protein
VRRFWSHPRKKRLVFSNPPLSVPPAARQIWLVIFDHQWHPQLQKASFRSDGAQNERETLQRTILPERKISVHFFVRSSIAPLAGG